MIATPATPSILADLALVLGVGALATVACERFRIPVVVGYLLAGLVVGPHVPIPLVADAANVHILSELGVILLMFSLGVEFNLKKLLRSGPTAALVALIQGGFMAWAGYLAGRVLGWTALESIFAGAAVSISSTMIIARVFDGLKVRGPLADLVLSTLIVQDLLAILLLALLTAVGSGAGLRVPDVLLTLGRLAAFLVLVTVLGRWLLPRTIRWIADAGSPETLLVAVMGLCFAYALLAAWAGYSVALGAFLAGMVVAESGRERQVERLVHPLRDLFVAVFFVSIGMQINPALLLPNGMGILVFGGLVLGGKVLSGALGGLLGGHSLRMSVRAGAALAQVGEFSFIIVALGESLGVVGPAVFPVLAATCVGTTLATPALVQRSDQLADHLEGNLPWRVRHFLVHHRAAMGHLRSLPFRREAWSHLRRPFAFLLLDSGLAVVWVGLGRLLHTGLTAWVEARGWSRLVAEPLVWFLTGLLVLRSLLGVVRHIRFMASAIAARAILERGDTAEGMEEAIRLFVELALGGMVILPLAALLQPMLPTGLVPGLALALVLPTAVLLWRRLGVIQRGWLADPFSPALGRGGQTEEPGPPA